MKKLVHLFSLILAFSLLGAACGNAGSGHDGVKTIGAAEFKKLQTEPNTVVLDVRTPEEVAGGIIQGASLFLDYHSAEFAQQLDGLDKEKTYLVYCRSGNRSGKAGAMMQEKGFKKLYNLEGGISAWQEPLGTK